MLEWRRGRKGCVKEREREKEGLPVLPVWPFEVISILKKCFYFTDLTLEHYEVLTL